MVWYYISMRDTSSGYYALRFNVLKRDNFTCQYCGQHAPDVKLEVDHIVPIVEGGTNEESNLITSCYACNRGKEGLRVIVNKGKNPKVRVVAPVDMVNRLQPVLKYIEDKNSVVKSNDISSEFGISIENARMILSRLYKKGLICKVSFGVYASCHA